LESLLSFIVTSAIIEITPGPNMAYLAILSASEGRRSGLFAVAGIALGLLTVGVAASLGLAALIESSDLAYQTLRWCGVLYMFWLAWDAWNTGKNTAPERTNKILWKRRQLFDRGFITNLLNPKAAVFYVAILPSFINGAGSVLNQTILLTVTYVSVATAIHSLIVLLAGTAQKFFDKPEQILALRKVLALMLALVAVWFACSTGRAR
jgi:threonine/homoserine/homoserine lactone efflux protein